MSRSPLILLDLGTLLNLHDNNTITLKPKLDTLLQQLREQSQTTKESVHIGFIINRSKKEHFNIKLQSTNKQTKKFNAKAFLKWFCDTFLPDFKHVHRAFFTTYNTNELPKFNKKLQLFFPHDRYNTAVLSTRRVKICFANVGIATVIPEKVDDFLASTLKDSGIENSEEDSEPEDELIIIPETQKPPVKFNLEPRTHTVPARGSSEYFYGFPFFKKRNAHLAYEAEDIQTSSTTEMVPTTLECAF